MTRSEAPKGAVEDYEAHNPRVGGSTPSPSLSTPLRIGGVDFDLRTRLQAPLGDAIVFGEQLRPTPWHSRTESAKIGSVTAEIGGRKG
jgi:hypothetical protein